MDAAVGFGSSVNRYCLDNQEPDIRGSYVLPESSKKSLPGFVPFSTSSSMYFFYYLCIFESNRMNFNWKF